jgi:hypothetical protein
MALDTLDTEAKPAAPILSVTYERLYNLGNYENQRLGAVAAVVDGDVLGAFLAAREAVEAEHELLMVEAGRISEIRPTLRSLERHKRQLEAEIKELEARLAPEEPDSPIDIPF